MDNVKHTPGPWQAEKVYGDWNVYDGKENLVATIHGAEAHEQKPNAHLIAATTDMLEALKEIVGTADEYKAMPTKSLLDRLLSAIGDARPAIAKATGGAS